MTDNNKLITVLNEYILFGFTRCENDLISARNAYYSDKTLQNNYAVVESWIKKEQFRKIAGELQELIRYCSDE